MAGFSTPAAAAYPARFCEYHVGWRFWDESRADDFDVAQRAEEFGPRVDSGVVVVTAGIDVQDDRIESRLLGMEPIRENGRWIILRYTATHPRRNYGKIWARSSGDEI